MGTEHKSRARGHESAPRQRAAVVGGKRREIGKKLTISFSRSRLSRSLPLMSFDLKTSA